MITGLFIGSWVLCGILAYRIDRATVRSHLLWTWTKGDRNFNLMFGLLGPIALITSMIVYICFNGSNDDPSSW